MLRLFRLAAPHTALSMALVLLITPLLTVYMPNADAEDSPTATTVGHSPLTWSELQARPLPPSVPRIPYGRAAQQFGELRVPSGRGPFPVVILVHGGCWLAEFDYVYMTRLSAALTAAGYATWTPEFRRIGDAGGGWPNTLLDVGAAADALRTLAPNHHLDLHRVVAIGHSSGGHLALWLAARHRLAADSALYATAPLPLAGVVGLAAITDLATYRVGPADSCNASVDQLLGGTPQTVPQRYAQASPRALLPLGVAQVLIQGGLDPIVKPESARDYVDAAQAAGDAATLALIGEDGHFDLANPEGAAWTQLQDALHRLLPEYAH